MENVERIHATKIRQIVIREDDVIRNFFQALAGLFAGIYHVGGNVKAGTPQFSDFDFSIRSAVLDQQHP